MASTHDPYTVSRNLWVAEMLSSECEKNISEALGTLDGVSKVVANWQKGLITVCYDLHKTHIQDVEKLLSDIGYPLADGFWAGKKRAWVYYKEKNEINNLKHIGHCCSKPPTGA
jgi:copper chaperone CopZ